MSTLRTDNLQNTTSTLTIPLTDVARLTALSASGGAALIGYGASTVAAELGKVSQEVVNPEAYGAVGNGTTDDTAAINSALATGKIVSGKFGKVYAVSGDIILPPVTRMRDISFKQLDPASTTRRTLYQQAGTYCSLVNVVVDRNGTATSGAVATSGGVWINGASKVELTRVEVTGNGYGNGIVIVSCTDVNIDKAYVHDMAYGSTTSPVVTDDQIQGIWIISATRVVISSPVIKNLTGQWTGQASFARFTRGIAFGNAKDFTIIAPTIDNVDQGIDVTGDMNPARYAILGGTMSNCLSFGVKAANSAQYGKIVGVTAYRCGKAGFVASSPATDLGTLNTGSLDFVACHALETNFTGYWTALANVAGFRIETSGSVTTYPRGVRFTSCQAIANGSAMKYGFFSDANLGGNGDIWNETINCTATGFTVSGYAGFQQGIHRKQVSSAVSIANNAWTNIVWSDGSTDRMSANGSTMDQVVIRRSGLYMVTVGATFTGNATGTRGLRVLSQGGLVNGSDVRISAADNNPKSISTTCLVLCEIGDIITSQALQESGGALTITAGAITVALVNAGQGRV